MRKKNAVLTLIAAALCITLFCGCGTSVGEHTNTYFSQLVNVVTTAINASKAEKEAGNGTVAEETVPENALASPANFSVAEDGTYSFDAVENAQYYCIYVYTDSVSVESVAQSGKIMDDGSGTYTGNVNDFNRFTYEDWNIRVVAYPDYENSDYVASPAAKCDYVVTGEVAHSELTFGYMWSVATNNLVIKVDGMDYGMTAYPTEVIITLTNTSDSSDVQKIEITDVSSSSASGSTDTVTAGADYDISATLNWNADYVSNPTYSVAGGEALTSDSENTISGDFEYSSSIFNSFDFPHVQQNFDPVAGGLAGKWYHEGGGMMNFGPPGAEQDTGDEEEIDYSCYFEATPIAAAAGALYSYDIVITSPSGSITATPKLSPGSATTSHIFGTMDIYDDGTFKMEIEYQYISTDMMNSAVYYVPGVICMGVYSTNSDGTLNLSYDHENAYETDYDIVTELTGKAAEYAAEHPEESGSSAGDFPGGDFGEGMPEFEGPEG